VLPLLSSEWRKATQGRTASAVFARLKGNWQRCSIRNGGGIFESSWGSPISSEASLRAVSQGVSSRVSALPPGNAAWPVESYNGCMKRREEELPEKFLKLAARRVITTRRSPRRSAKSRTKTAALLLRGSRSHTANGGGLYALKRAIAAWCLLQNDSCRIYLEY
jgi:hypothetical protein